MAKKRKKAVEYTDTFSFAVFPKYTYTKAQSKRLRLFQGRVEHFKKAVNYADSFPDSDKINLLYMIGYDPKMKAYVEKTKCNVVILCAKFTPEDLEIYDRYKELCNSLSAAGLTDKDGNLSDIYRSERELTLKYRNQDDIIEASAKRYEKEAKIIEAYEALKVRSKAYYERYTIIDKLHPEKTISHDNLDWIIKRYFPKGREQYGLADKSYKGIKTVWAALEAGLSRLDCKSMFGIGGETSTSELFKSAIKRCEMDINTALRAKGWVDLKLVFKRMQEPPYGWSKMDAHTAYCLGYALSSYQESGYVWDGVNAWTFEECTSRYFAHLIDTFRTWFEFILFTEDGWRLVNRLAYMFDAPKILPLPNMVQKLCTAIESKTRYPVSLIDERLNELLVCRDKATILFDSDFIRKYIDYFNWERCTDIREKYAKINSVVPEMVKAKYPKLSLEDLERRCTTTASGWCWSAEIFWDTVEHCASGRPFWEKNTPKVL